MNSFQRTVIASPSTFVSAKSWKMNSSLLREVLLEVEFSGENEELHVQRKIASIRLQMTSNFRTIQLRNEAILFQGEFQLDKGSLRQKVADVQVSLLFRCVMS